VACPVERPGEAQVDIRLRDRSEDGWDVLDVAGEVDLSTAPVLRARLDEVISGGSRRLIVSLEEVTFMDSSGLSVLVSAFKAMREAGGRISLVCDEPTIAKIFTITGLDRILSIHTTLREAVSA